MKYQITDELIYANSMGPNPIKLLTWNLQGVTVLPKNRILDLGSGKALTSVYLANEFDADVIAYDDFVKYKGEQAAKEAGKWRLEGKEYVVQEGDLMHFRFNV